MPQRLSSIWRIAGLLLWFENGGMPQDLLPTDLPPGQAEAAASFVGEMPKLTHPIAVVDSDPQWAELYLREAARLRAVLGDKVLELEHVGSTSVPGLAAKPIIDLDLSVSDSADEAAYLPALEAAGYRLILREPHWLEHRMLKGPETEINLHVWTLGSPEAQRHLILRDWLRANAADRKMYGDHKRALAKRPYSYMYEYNNDKAGVIREILARALAAQEKE